MDGQTTGAEEGGFQSLEEADGKEETSDQVPEGTVDAVIEEKKNLGGDEISGDEECKDPVDQAIEDGDISGKEAVGDGEVKDDGSNGEVDEEDVNNNGEHLEEGESNVKTVESDENEGRVAALRRGGISAEHIAEPEESIQEKVSGLDKYMKVLCVACSIESMSKTDDGMSC